MEWLPAASAEVAQMALPPESAAAVHRAVAPSSKVTLPVGAKVHLAVEGRDAFLLWGHRH